MNNINRRRIAKHNSKTFVGTSHKHTNTSTAKEMDDSSYEEIDEVILAGDLGNVAKPLFSLEKRCYGLVISFIILLFVFIFVLVLKFGTIYSRLFISCVDKCKKKVLEMEAQQDHVQDVEMQLLDNFD